MPPFVGSPSVGYCDTLERREALEELSKTRQPPTAHGRGRKKTERRKKKLASNILLALLGAAHLNASSTLMHKVAIIGGRRFISGG